MTENKLALDADLQRRNIAFRMLDVAYARRRCPELSSDYAALVALHKARYECVAIEDSLRHASRRFLEARGLTRYRGIPWPPDGELPT